MNRSAWLWAFFAHLRAPAAALVLIAALGPTFAQGYEDPSDQEMQADEGYGAPDEGPGADGPYRRRDYDDRYGPPPQDFAARRPPPDRYGPADTDERYDPPPPHPRASMEPSYPPRYPPDVERRDLPPPVARLAPIPLTPPPDPPRHMQAPLDGAGIRQYPGNAEAYRTQAPWRRSERTAKQAFHAPAAPMSAPAPALRAHRAARAATESYPPTRPAQTRAPSPVATKRQTPPPAGTVAKTIAPPPPGAAAPKGPDIPPASRRESALPRRETTAPATPPLRQGEAAGELAITNKAESKFNLDR